MGYDFSIIHSHTVALMGDAATFSPASGPDVDCTVLFKAPDAMIEFSDAYGVVSAPHIRVQSSEVSAPLKGDEFIIGAVTYRIMSAPKINAHGDMWDCPVAVA